MARKIQMSFWILLSIGILSAPGILIPLGGVIAGG